MTPPTRLRETPAAAGTAGDHDPAAPPSRRRADTSIDVLVALALVGTFATYMVLTRDTWFYIDEWSMTSRGLTPTDLFRQYNGHLSIGIIATYRIVFSLFGFDHHWVLRAISYGALVALAGLLYLTTKARWGAPTAAAVAIGVAWLRAPGLDPASMNHWVAAGAGVVVAWALPREGRRADRVTAAALVVAFLSAGGAVVVAAAALAYCLLARAPRSRWIAVGVPTAMWAVWYLVEGRTGPELPARARLGWVDLARVPYHGVAGTFRGAALGSELLAVALAVVYGVLVVRRLRHGGRDGRATFVAWGGAAVLWWVSLGYSRGLLTDPDTSRYRVVCAALLVLAVVPTAAEAARPVARRLQPAWAGPLAVAALALVLVAGNQSVLRSGAETLTDGADATRRQAALAATDVSRREPDHRYGWLLGFQTQRQLDATFARYGFDAPATVEELDRYLLDHGAAVARPAEAPTAECHRLRRPSDLTEPGTVLWATDEPVPVEIRRFGDEWMPLTELRPGGAIILRTQTDAVDQLWQVRADGACR